jgi:MarR family transcriptional regulator, multiple gene regulator MgrA
MRKKIAKGIVSSAGFQNHRHEALTGLLLVNAQVNQEQQQFFKPFGITPNQYNLLRILRGQHPRALASTLLRRRMFDKSSDVTRLVTRLENLGFVCRQRNENDLRLVLVNITETGLGLLAELDNKINHLWKLNGISDTEANVLADLLEKILMD